MFKYITLALSVTLGLFLYSCTENDGTGAQTDENSASSIAEIEEWEVPYEESRPRDPYVAPDGNVWFVGQRSDYVAEFDTESEEFRRIDLPDGAGPHNLIVDDEGMIWYAGNRAAHIGKVDPEDGSIEQIPMPNESPRDPHTLVFDQNGDIWFTAQGANMIGRLTVSTGELELIDVPTERARPYGIVIDADNNPWIALFGTNKLATVDRETMELTEIEIERPEARPRRLQTTSDGRVWYGDYSQGYLGVYNPADQSFEEWMMPDSTDSRPYAMAVDANDNLWMVATGVNPNTFVGFDPETESFHSSTPVESGGGTIRHMVFHEPTNAIWFGTDTNYLGKATLE